MAEATRTTPEVQPQYNEGQIVDAVFVAIREREAAGQDLFANQQERCNIYAETIDNVLGDEAPGTGTPERANLGTVVLLESEFTYLSDQPAGRQTEARDQFGTAIDQYLSLNPKIKDKSNDIKNAKREEFMAKFKKAVEEHNQNSQRLTRRAKTATASGFAAVKGVFYGTKDRIQSKFSREEVETVDINDLSNEELNSRYDQARKKYAKVVHQDTTRAFFKFRMPRTAKKAKEEFYALQSEFFNRNSKDKLVAGTNKTIAQFDYIANLQALSEAQEKDKSPLQALARKFAKDKIPSNIATNFATGLLIKGVAAFMAGSTGGISIAAGLVGGRLLSINNSRFKKDSDKDKEAKQKRFYKEFEDSGTDNFNNSLEDNKETESAELRKRIRGAAGRTAIFGGLGYGIGEIIDHFNVIEHIKESGIGKGISDLTDGVRGGIGNVVDWVRDHTPLPDSVDANGTGLGKYTNDVIGGNTGTPSDPNFSTRPGTGETLTEWKDRISGGKGLAGQKAEAADKMFEIFQDPEKTKVFTGFLEQVSTPEGAMDFARMHSLIQNSPDPLKAAGNFSNLMSNAPKPSTQALESAKDVASLIKSGLGPNGPSVIGNIQGYLQTTSSPSPETINSILRANHLNSDEVIGFMSHNKSLAEELLGKNWRNLFSK